MRPDPHATLAAGHWAARRLEGVAGRLRKAMSEASTGKLPHLVAAVEALVVEAEALLQGPAVEAPRRKGGARG
jgi:hypothetical protein